MKELRRDYKMSDPALKLKAEDVLDSIERDVTEFNAHGWTAAKKTEFEGLIAAFDAMPSDNYLKGQQQIKTAVKDTIRAEAEEFAERFLRPLKMCGACTARSIIFSLKTNR